jgi:hypothetical protein
LEKTAQLKASVVNSAMSYTSRSLGDPALKSILASFDSKAISRKRLPSDWVPEKTYRDYLVATRRYLESSAPEKRPKDFFFDMGKSIAGEGINKYYKSLIKMFDMTFMLTKSPMIWGVTHSHGSLTVEPMGKTGAYVYLTDFPAPSKEFCTTMCGYMYVVGELTRAKMVRVEELECVTEGARRCRFIGEWK